MLQESRSSRPGPTETIASGTPGQLFRARVSPGNPGKMAHRRTWGWLLPSGDFFNGLAGFSRRRARRQSFRWVSRTIGGGDFQPGMPVSTSSLVMIRPESPLRRSGLRTPYRGQRSGEAGRWSSQIRADIPDRRPVLTPHSVGKGHSRRACF